MIHALKSQSNGLYQACCGITVKARSLPDDFTGWNSKTTCPCCATCTVLHLHLTTWEEVMLLIDLDDPAVAQRFHFTGKRFSFRWLIGGRLIYVYNSQESFSPMLAIHLPYGEESSYQVAQLTAREWISKHGDSHGETTHKAKPALQKPVVPSGPHCDYCKKPEEGDCVPHPKDPTLLACMACFIKESRKK